MPRSSSVPLGADILANAPPLPLDPKQWAAVVCELKLSAKQAQIVELMLRDLSDREIALVLGISESTIETYKERINLKSGTRGRMQLAMRVLSLSHEIKDKDGLNH